MSTIITNNTRRSFLKAGASVLALPFLESLMGRTSAATASTIAAGTSTIPKRMVFLGGGYGFTNSYRNVGEDLFPKQAGKLKDLKVAEIVSLVKNHNRQKY